MEGSLSVLLSTLLAQAMAKRWGLDWSQSGGLTMVLHVIFGKLESWQISGDQSLYITIVGLLVVIALTSWHFQMRWSATPKKVRPSGITLNLYVKSHIELFVDYLKRNPSMSHTPDSFDHGDPHLLAQAYAQSIAVYTSNSVNRAYDPSSFSMRAMSEVQDRASFSKPETGITISFHDSNFDTNGTYCWRLSKQEVRSAPPSDNKVTIQMPYIELWIEKQSDKLPDPCSYLAEIEKWILQERNKSRTLYLAHVTQDCDTYVYTICDGPRLSLRELERRYIDTFFQKDKQRIWETIKTIDQTPDKILELGQFPQAGFLLHGPPGTGKSSFAYRVAQTLSRHIVNVDIRNLANRANLYQVMRKPYFQSRYWTPKDVVFVFDEFDLTVKELARRKTINLEIMQRWMTDTTEFKSNVNLVTADDPSSGKKKNMGAMKLNATGFGGNDDIQLHDLLEVFQGVVPSHQALIFATSNCYDELRTLCPQLFRVGRLTPIQFDHFDSTMINRISEFYFGQGCMKENETSKICPSQLVEALCDSVSIPNDRKQAPPNEKKEKLSSELVTRFYGFPSTKKTDGNENSSQEKRFQFFQQRINSYLSPK